uniref:Uncharacterized protein n=1 Tax=Plectus sambesii TaxID=2011161 RepID=A0A914UT46_9BILA
MPAMWHLSELLESIKRVSGSSYGYTSAADRKRKMIEDLCNKRDLFDTITGCIVEAQKEAIALAKGAQRCSTPDRTSVDSSGRLSIDTNPSTLLMSAPTITQKVTTLKLESSNFVNPSLTMSDGNDYGAHINGLLKFLSLLLEEGSLQFSWSKVKHIWETLFSWSKVKHIWETLVENPQACDFDRKSCFEWFRNLRDSEICEEAMNKLLIDKLLKLDVTRLTVEGFNCFRRFFDAVNKNKGKLKMFSNSYPPEVEDLDLVGLDFVWETALSCADPEIADQSVRLLIDLSYSLLSQKLKKDAESLHRRFLDECSRRLELCRVTLKGSLIGRLLQDAGKQLSACSVPKISTVPMANHGEKKRSVERLLLIASRYIVMVEEEFQSRRVHPPHGTTFHGHLFSITYTSDIDDHKGTGRLLTHGKETLRSVRERLAGRLKYGDQRKEFDLEFNGNKLDHVKDYMTLEQLEVMPANGGDSVQMAVKRRYGFLSTSSQLEKDALVRELQLPSVVLMSTGT